MNTKFQYYTGSRMNKSGETKPDLKPKGFISLEKTLQAIKTPSIELMKKIEAIRKTEDQALKNRLKLELPKVTPCTIIKDWKLDINIIFFTGLMALDFDKLTINEAEALKKDLFNEYPCIIASWLSSSKKGFRAFVRIPEISLKKGIDEAKNEFKEYFNAFRLSLPPKYKGFDESLKSPSKLMFISFDNEVLVRKNSTIFIDRIPERKPYYTSKQGTVNILTPYSGFVETSLNNRRYIARIRGIINSMMKENIVSKNGHYTVLKASQYLGGFVGSGYLDFTEAQNIIFYLIDKSEYLSKGIEGYKKTALDSLQSGINKPIELNNN